MNFAKYLLVTLALWMPVASFATAAIMGDVLVCAADCEDDSLPDEATGSETVESDVLLAHFIGILYNHKALHLLEIDGHCPLDGHLVEPLIPPPNLFA